MAVASFNDDAFAHVGASHVARTPSKIRFSVSASAGTLDGARFSKRAEDRHCNNTMRNTSISTENIVATPTSCTPTSRERLE